MLGVIVIVAVPELPAVTELLVGLAERVKLGPEVPLPLPDNVVAVMKAPSPGVVLPVYASSILSTARVGSKA